uniref:Reverse transcriptase domain-containing protein n=1 Tax=Tanacetum cinerariifolium TaxID=118510 RepID=A0A6L2JT05_TANCI|nr:reverse transcriptase domain-containing protein [Tanacetum cinerariifolium]
MSAMANVTPIIAIVKNASVKEKTLKETDVVPKASILDFCEEHYEDILPIILDMVHHDKRKEVQTRLDFRESPKKVQRERESSLNSRAGNSPIRFHHERSRTRGRERHDDKNVFNRLRHRRKSVHERCSDTYSPSITKSGPSRASSRDPSHSRGRSLSRDRHRIKDRLRGIEESYDDSSHGTGTKYQKAAPVTEDTGNQGQKGASQQMKKTCSYHGPARDPEDHLKIFQAASQQKKYVKDPVEIHNIKQRDGETIEEFMERFKIETERIKGAPECMRISGFMHGVNNPELTKRLNEHVPKTVEEMMTASTAFIRGETVAASKKKVHTSWKSHDQSKRHTSERRSDFQNQPKDRRGSNKFTPLTRTPKEIFTAESGKFKPPSPMVTPVEKRSSNKFSTPKDSEKKAEDCYPLPENDWKVESLCGYPFKCFLDAYKGYHQIHMAEQDEEKTAFHTSHGVYCYTKMPFSLKNAGATYQRLVDKAFDRQIVRNLEIYVDDLVIKSHTETVLLRDIEETFRTLRKINMKLNPKKNTFGAAEGMFLGYMIRPEGIKPCPNKTEAVLQLPSPRRIKEVKRHLAKLPMVVAPKPKEDLVMYLSTSYGAISVVLMTEIDAVQTLVYFVSQALQAPELNYTPMKKLVLALVCTAKRSGNGLILTSPEGTEFTYALRFQLTASNNEAEYEALIAGLRISAQMGVRNVHVNIHEGSCIMHAGPRSVVDKVMRSGYYWPTMPRHPQQPLTPITAPWPFYKWGINIAGPFSEGPGKVKLLIVVMHYFTKWIEAKVVATITGSQVKKFVWDNIVCHFGLPGEIVSDNGKQFSGDPFKDWCEKLNIVQRFASVKHPHSNGLVERANTSLGEGIKSRLGEGNKNCLEELLHVLWAHRTMIKLSNDDTPFSLTYGTEAVIPAEIGMPTYRTTVVDVVHNDEELLLNLDLLEERRERAAIREAKTKLKMTKYYNVRVRGVTFRLGDYVYRTNDASHAVDGGKLGSKWEGAYEVMKALGDGAYMLRFIDGVVLSSMCNIANLKKCTSEPWLMHG